jgi:hypothetical protein
LVLGMCQIISYMLFHCVIAFPFLAVNTFWFIVYGFEGLVIYQMKLIALEDTWNTWIKKFTGSTDFVSNQPVSMLQFHECFFLGVAIQSIPQILIQTLNNMNQDDWSDFQYVCVAFSIFMVLHALIKIGSRGIVYCPDYFQLKDYSMYLESYTMGVCLLRVRDDWYEAATAQVSSISVGPGGTFEAVATDMEMDVDATEGDVELPGYGHDYTEVFYETDDGTRGYLRAAPIGTGSPAKYKPAKATDDDHGDDNNDGGSGGEGKSGAEAKEGEENVIRTNTATHSGTRPATEVIIETTDRSPAGTATDRIAEESKASIDNGANDDDDDDDDGDETPRFGSSPALGPSPRLSPTGARSHPGPENASASPLARAGGGQTQTQTQGVGCITATTGKPPAKASEPSKASASSRYRSLAESISRAVAPRSRSRGHSMEQDSSRGSSLGSGSAPGVAPGIVPAAGININRGNGDAEMNEDFNESPEGGMRGTIAPAQPTSGDDDAPPPLQTPGINMYADLEGEAGGVAAVAVAEPLGRYSNSCPTS